jgi:hypothetical protein
LFISLYIEEVATLNIEYIYLVFIESFEIKINNKEIYKEKGDELEIFACSHCGDDVEISLHLVEFRIISMKKFALEQAQALEAKLILFQQVLHRSL